MNRLSKEKRQQLILVGLLTALALVGLWFGVIRSQQQSLTTLKARTETAKQRLATVKHAIQTADQTDKQLCDSQKELVKYEEAMATGDLYSWAITTIRTFKLDYKVDIPQFSQIDGPKAVDLLPDFPYKQVTLTVAGSASFNEFGRFLADFENHFPHMRLLNLSLEPGSGQGDPEKLSFKMQIAALVKAGAS